MIRRGTIFLVAVFIVLAALAFYVQRNPPASSAATITPAPTAYSPLLEEWTTTDITVLERDIAGETLRLERNAEGGWNTDDESAVVSMGVVEQALAEILSLRPVAYLDAGIDLEAVGMAAPTATILLENAAGERHTLQIGALTPTGGGYYLRFDDRAPAVVDRYAVDGLLELLQAERLLPTLEPILTPTATE